MMTPEEFRKLNVWAKSPAKKLHEEAVSARERVTELLKLLARAPRSEDAGWHQEVQAALEIGRKEGLVRRLDELTGAPVRLPPDEPPRPPVLRAPVEDRPGNEAVNVAKGTRR